MENSQVRFCRAKKKALSITGLPATLSVLILIFTASCSITEEVKAPPGEFPVPVSKISALEPDPRVGLDGGLFDAETAIRNLDLISTTPPPETFTGSRNSDLAFMDHYVIQGNYDGFIIWDISDPSSPELVVDYLCPASQGDVSVFENLLFVSGEGLEGRLDCGTEGVENTVSEERFRGVRIFNITDIEEPELITNVQTCRGSHTHSLLETLKDDENIYIYSSGIAPVRPEEEMEGCASGLPTDKEYSSLFRIDVIKVPVESPEKAHLVREPEVLTGLEPTPVHGFAPADLEAIEDAKAEDAFIFENFGHPFVLPDSLTRELLNDIVEEREGTGRPTAADSTVLRENLDEILMESVGWPGEIVEYGPDQCHDITHYPEIGLAAGACDGYGLLLDISDPLNPVRVNAVADSNFAYWHSATFNNNGNTVVFTDEWGAGMFPKCRETDPMEWGANAIYTIGDDYSMEFRSYYKMPAPQTPMENCVAHNGSLIPVPGRDIMVQAWYQGGISVFDFTDPDDPVEIAFFDRGPVSEEDLQFGGSWSVYWYNGYLVSSEIARGLDILALKESPYITKNEIAAANTIRMDVFNPQGQPAFQWPATYALARAYLDQLARNEGLDRKRIEAIRQDLYVSEQKTGARQGEMLVSLADEIETKIRQSPDPEKVGLLVDTLRELASSE